MIRSDQSMMPKNINDTKSYGHAATQTTLKFERHILLDIPNLAHGIVTVALPAPSYHVCALRSTHALQSDPASGFQDRHPGIC